MRFAMAVAVSLAALAAGSAAEAQRGGLAWLCNNPMSYDSDDYFISPHWQANPIYDGRITFVRIKYKGKTDVCSDEGPGWAHDYPVTESHLVKIMEAVTTMRPFVKQGLAESSAILSWKDPGVFNYPVAWMSEPGFWTMDAQELAGFKRFIERGGFVVFDDLGWRGRNDLPNLTYQWQRAFPNAQLVKLTQDHPIFNTFFQVDLAKITPYCDQRGCYGTGAADSPEYYAIYQDNDPKKRMLAVINNNNDLGEFMQYSDRGFNVVPSNEAYKLTINYFIYALTH